MLFVLRCIDKPDQGQLRATNRSDHLDYLRSAGDRLKLAGPLQDDAGEPIGSLIILDAASIGAARVFAQNDPYARAGLFADVSIAPFKPVLGHLSAALDG